MRLVKNIGKRTIICAEGEIPPNGQIFVSEEQIKILEACLLDEIIVENDTEGLMDESPLVPPEQKKIEVPVATKAQAKTTKRK